MRKLVVVIIAILVAASSCTTAIGSLVGDMGGSSQESRPPQKTTDGQKDEEETQAPSQNSPQKTSPSTPAQQSPQQVTESPQTTDDGDWGSTETAAEDQLGVLINARPQGANVFINRKYLGQSPVLFLPSKPGSYLVTATAEGYREKEVWVNYAAGSYVVLEMELDLITGYLNVNIQPPRAKVTLNGQEVNGGVNEIAIGTYNVEIESFGYQKWTGRVQILDGATTYLEVTLQEAAFSTTGIDLSRETFNPANPGSLGRVVGSFEVTAPGTGFVRVINLIGDEIMRIPLDPFITWEQRFEWDGITSMGFQAPDGDYIFELNVVGASGIELKESATVKIDSTQTVNIRSTWNGVGGLLYAPDTSVLPPLYFQVIVSGMGHVVAGGGFRAPIQAGVRVGIPDNMELTVQGTLIATGAETTPFSAGASLKYNILPPGQLPVVSLSAYAKATYLSGETYDTQTNFTGLSVGAVTGFDVGQLRILLSPEIIGSTSGVAYPSDPVPGSGPRLWGYVRSGAFVDTGGLVAGVSGAVRTGSFADGFSIHYPFIVGAEAHWIIPSTSMVLNGNIASEIDPTGGFYILGGVGLSFLN